MFKKYHSVEVYSTL